MIEVPKVFPPKKIWHFLYLTLAPQTTKKKCQWKKTQWVFASPVWQQVIMCCSCVTTWSLLRPASSIIRPLYEWSLSAAFENDHYVNSQNIVFVSVFGQLCRVVVSYKYQSGLCVCYHIPSWSAVISGVINRYWDEPVLLYKSLSLSYLYLSL